MSAGANTQVSKTVKSKATLPCCTINTTEHQSHRPASNGHQRVHKHQQQQPWKQNEA